MTRMFPWLLYTFVFSLLVRSGKGEKDILKFLKVREATLSPTTVLETVVSTTPEDCATTCLSTETCKSFEITRNAPHTCLLYEEDTSERRMSYSTQYDFYQARQSKCPLNIVYRAALYGYNDLDQNKAIFTKCVNRCQKEPTCKSIELHSGLNGCQMSSSSQLTLYVNTNDWYYVEVNRDILEEVLIRSPSDKHITNECNVKTSEGIISFYKKDILKFLKVREATLSPTTVLETIVSTTPEDCATTCLSTETCKSFEITRNAPHTCLLYEEDTSERRMSYSTQYDFYQARQSKCPLNIVYRAALYGYNDLDQNKAIFTKCVNRCQKEPTCKSIELHSGLNGCQMSSSSQLTLYVNTNDWYYVEVNRDILEEVVKGAPFHQPRRNECNVKAPEGIPSFYKKPVDSSSEMAYFEREYNPYVDIENMLEIPVRSQVDCSVECLRNDDCIAFSYHSGEQKTCQLKRRI